MPECDFTGTGIDEYMGHLRTAAKEQCLPFKGVFELTPRCNFNCNMCYVHLKPDEIPAVGREFTAEEWIDIAKEAQEAGTIELTLTGGEPFVRPDFREIYEAVHDMGFLIQIFSNGYLLTEEIVSWLQKRPPRTMRFTLYGASDEAYEKVCGVSGGFTRVKNSIRLLKEAGIPLYIVATLTKDNRQDAEAIGRFAMENRLPFTFTSSLVDPVRGASADAKAHQIDTELPPAEIIRQIRQQNGGKYPRKRRENFLEVCSNNRCGYWITWNRQMQLCTFLTEPSAAVRPGTFMESWRRLQEQLLHLKEPEACAFCRYEAYCDRCPGILYAEAGENGKTAESVCRKAEYNYVLYGKPLDKEETE